MNIVHVEVLAYDANGDCAGTLRVDTSCCHSNTAFLRPPGGPGFYVVYEDLIVAVEAVRLGDSGTFGSDVILR